MKKVYFFALGTMLLTASCMREHSLKITVSNITNLDRSDEIVEIIWDDIKDQVKLGKGESFVILDEQGQQVPYQLVTYGKPDPELLIFPASVKANAKGVYKMQKGKPEQFESMAEVNFVPQRKDDISWENNRVGYRMYGPALEADPRESFVSGGIDVWAKSTPKLVVQKWYKDDLGGIKSYHKDGGEGLDFYVVGKSVGAGAAAPVKGDTVYYVSHNFKSHEILDNGPLRVVFKLTYAPYQAAGQEVNETRTISLDAGSNMNKIIEDYGRIKEPMTIGAGFPYYNNEDIVINAPQGYLSYQQPADPANGTIYLGVVSDSPLMGSTIVDKQVLALMNYEPDYSHKGGMIYYSGAGWSKGGFPTFDDWTTYVKDFSYKLRNPLLVAVSAEE